MMIQILAGLCLIGSSCTKFEQPPGDPGSMAATAMEVPVIPDEPSGAGEPQAVQELPSSEASGDVQERGVTRVLPGGFSSAVLGGGIATLPTATQVLGDVAIRTMKGYYLTAINGGGRSADPTIITATTAPGPWERFKIAIPNPGQVYDKAIQTVNGNFVTAVGGGGRSSDVLHSDATQVKDWERFHLVELTLNSPSFYGIQTIKGGFVTAVGAGGKYQDAIHTDAKQINAWERFRIVKCGDPGSGHEYGILAANGQFLSGGGGAPKNGIFLSPPQAVETKFKFFRQTDGRYAFQTANGKNYVGALGGGGNVQNYYPPDCGMFSACIGGYSDLFHTDATQIQAWEKFRVIDQGNCTYAIQTSSGFFVGIHKGYEGKMYLTTRRDGASTANEKFQLVLYGLGSPAVIQ
jgi:hypothetical protein